MTTIPAASDLEPKAPAVAQSVMAGETAPMVEASSPIARARAAGYTDDEIDAWLKPRWAAAHAAGYTDDEIRRHLGLPEPAPETLESVPQPFLDRIMQGTAAGRVLQRFAKGAAHGWGEDRLGLNPESEKYLRDIGVFPDPERGTLTPLRILNEAAIQPLAAGVEAVLRGISAITIGGAEAVGQAGVEAGLLKDESEGKQFARDLVGMAEVAGLMIGGGAPVARLERTPDGVVREVPVGTLPKSGDFQNAARVLTEGEVAPAVEAKLPQLWREKGIHPAEVPLDAARDVTIVQDLAATNRDVPLAYGGKVPEPKLALTASDFAGRVLPRDLAEVGHRHGFDSPEFIRAEREWIDAARDMKFPEGTEGTFLRPDLVPTLAMQLQEEAGWRPAQIASPEAYIKAAVGQTFPANMNRFHVLLGQARRHDDLKGGLPEGASGTSPAAPNVPARAGGAGGKGPPPPDGPDGALPGGETPKALPKPGSLDDARAKVLSQISIGAREHKEPFTFQKLYTLLVDDLNPVRETVKEFAGKSLPAAEDPYVLFRLTRGTFGKADQMLERGTFDFNTYKTNGAALREIMAPVADDLDGVRAYAAARRAIELDARGIASGIDLDAARMVVAKGDKYQPVLDELVGFQNRVTAYLRDAGVISKRTYDAMLEANKNYVPFFRVMDPELMERGTGKGLGAKNPLRKIEGSERALVDPLESIVKNTYAYIALAEKNAAGLKLVDILTNARKAELLPAEAPPLARDRSGAAPALPDGTPGKLPPPRQEGVVKSEPAKSGVPAEIRDWFEAHGVKGAAADDLYATIRTATPADGHTIRVLRDGKPEEYKVPADLARVWHGLDQESASLVVRILAVPARALRTGAVLTPEFMARNAARDFLSAFVNSKGLFSPLDTVKGFLSVARQDTHFQNWLKGGGANSQMVAVDRAYLQENIFKLNERTGLVDRAINVARHPITHLRIASELIENATRLGEFRKVYDARVRAGLDEKAAIQAAAFASREVTLDFARIGAKMRAYNMITAFGNAQIQGVDRTIREAAKRPFNFAVKAGAGITLPSILLWWANRDDQRVQELPRWQKDLFWIVATDDWRDAGAAEGPDRTLDAYQRVRGGRLERNEGYLFRIPKPFEIGVIFGSLPERVLDAYATDHPDAFKGIEKAILEGFLPNLVPTVAAPVAEQWSNRSLFHDGPVIPSRLEKLLPEYQYTDYTTETAKRLGALIGAFPGVTSRALSDRDTVLGGVARALTSPILLENYLRGWTGGLGMYALKLLDWDLRQMGVVPDPVKPDEKLLLQIPAVRAFVVRHPTAQAKSIGDFYDRFEETERVWATVQAKAREGDAGAVHKTIALGPAAMLRLTAIRDALNEHSQLIHMVHLHPAMTPGDKRQLIDTLYFRMIDLARHGNAASEAARKTLQAPPPAKPMPPPDDVERTIDAGPPYPGGPPMRIDLTKEQAAQAPAVVIR